MAEVKDKTFLVIDDMKTMRTIVKQCLRAHGATNIVEADDGSTAWEVLESGGGEHGKIDFIVSDWNMPIMTGIDLLKKCRSDDNFKDIAFMMVTAEQEGGQVKEAIENGVDGYVVKPFNSASFGERLKQVFDKKFS
ncbi:MAG: response regulator [Bacteriovoracaceae bacterium]|nr:response regulator [Bacteriovoracaceae bacterium]